jgi:hypothetical protein
MTAKTYPAPAVRRIRVYAFDPQASTNIDSAGTNIATIALPWEAPWDEPLSPGPVNQYVEVVDVDPVSNQFYEPVDLNNRHLLAQDGLAPTEGDPRFHQQMVFAVAMKTIKAFERALGRMVFWRRKPEDPPGFIPKLRIYPHALREPNAYYSREKRALLFGYFRASTTDPGGNLPGGWVFTALSHDIIVHETTHAILDGLHPRFAENTGLDSLAFHEALADIVALLLHFTLPEAVHGVLAKGGGRLSNRSMLSDLAQQFGEATGRYAALRSAIDDKSSDGQPDPKRLSSLTEAHDRGAVLVAAVFDAFLTIYERRTADLLRLTHPGSDRDKLRDLHPDLVARLTREATRSADHLLRMCLRALDYLPPVDTNFGEFLRAIITADTDLVPDDPMNYRLAVVQAFRRRGIIPDNCLSLAPDSLLWERPASERLNKSLIQHLTPHYSNNVEAGSQFELDLFPRYVRGRAFQQAHDNAECTHAWLTDKQGDESIWENALGVYLDAAHFRKPLATLSHRPGRPPHQRPPVEVHSVRTTRRTGPDGQDLRQLVIEVTQERRGFYTEEAQQQQDERPQERPVAEGDFAFRGGATLIVDLRDGELRYVIRKRIDDEQRLKAQRAYLTDREWDTLSFTYGGPADRKAEPFALAHRGA